MDHLYDLKSKSENNVAELKKTRYDSPIALNRYLDACEYDIKIKCQIDRVKHENEKYGAQSKYASPIRYIGTIETPEGPKVGLCKSKTDRINI